MILDEKTFQEYIELYKFNKSQPTVICSHLNESELDIEMLDYVYAAKGFVSFADMISKFEKRKK